MAASDLDEQGINEGKVNRLLTRLVVRLLKHSRFRCGSVLLLPFGICIKRGRNTGLVEADTMRFIASNTSIPVPTVYCAFRHGRFTYLVMQKLRGQCLTAAWHYMSLEVRQHILRQLKDIVNEMRSLKPPSTAISNAHGGSIYDQRLPTSISRFGPFEDTQAFHRFLRANLERAPDGFPEVDEMIRLQSEDWGLPVFTHGDLSSLNIMVYKDNIVGIIDWETAGWFPPYWEHSTARQVNIHNLWWGDFIDQFVEPWPRAIPMEDVRKRWWGVI